ncbi:cytidylate kinase [Clostridium novyi A str. 4552]|uniref:Cytidylate kinase n=2 Tax=Clostridium novyi TaxID=1542 RepID=A0Q0L6_CLONN|nr:MULTISPECIES: (d)CMP kinase [Clostridium]ABK61130.1 cytidylate kinase [Clostridium novyi NT]KEH84867.1 cytidylate kinase [Clostridium novyi A str. NCTC 538]KEH85060.1 cytidylate kinase [Clostridium novyi A str. 4540]KEH88126.1 cytidylate kinase [Clostridium novyi A str. BKT29909]KEH91192.1 cytidylate kinase [Clostridium novyi A str. GD211209]
MKLNVAIDGPAGAGKSTIAKMVGSKFNLMYINTGSMYRAITLKALENNINSDNIEKLCDLMSNLEMHFENDRLILNGEDVNDALTLPKISENVSNYAAILEVREKLVYLQQKMAEKYDVIMDGRDIGTVVLKDAPFKFYITASPEERASRRYKELCSKNIEVNYDNILEEIKKRDYIDSTRKINPLTKAKDAIEIDTTTMSIDEVVNSICSIIAKKLNK